MSISARPIAVALVLSAPSHGGEGAHAQRSAASRPAQGLAVAPASSGSTAVRTSAEGFTINGSLTGPWYEAATSGLGFLLDVVPAAGVLSFGWFTFGPARADGGPPPPRWLTGAGACPGADAQITRFGGDGGAFQAGAVPGAWPQARRVHRSVGSPALRRPGDAPLASRNRIQSFHCLASRRAAAPACASAQNPALGRPQRSMSRGDLK